MASRPAPAIPALVGAILLAGILAGCTQDPAAQHEAEAQRVEAVAAPFLVEAHDGGSHTDAALHNGSANLELVGYSNGVDDSGDANMIPGNVTYSEIAVRDSYVFLNREDPTGALGGFVVIDVSDPARPHVVSSYDGLSGFDVETNPEGTLAFYASQRNSAQQFAGGLTSQLSPSGLEGRGIIAVDVTHKDKPVELGFTPLPYNGPHTLTYIRHPTHGDLLAVCTYDLAASTVPGQPGNIPVTQRVLLYQVEDVVVAGVRRVALEPLSQYQLPGNPPPVSGSQTPLVMPHDTRFEVHPLTGRPLLYVAYWDDGVRILDLSDPAKPTEIGSFTDFAPSRLNAIHLAQPMSALVAARHVTVAEPEIVEATQETGQVTLLDTTDPSHPQKLGHWTLPPGEQGQLGVTGLDFSPHNFDTWDGKVALGHYHAGVWVIGAGNEGELRDPPSLGFYLPHKPRAASRVPIPDVWGVVVHRITPPAPIGTAGSARAPEDLLFVSDQGTGLYILRYTGP